MSETGSPAVGFVADSVRLSVVLFVDLAPPSILIVPDGAAVSRYSVYDPEPLLLFCTTTPSNWLGSAPVLYEMSAGLPGETFPELATAPDLPW
jgi:hypothetical protein